jgi:hypothetical protein
MEKSFQQEKENNCDEGGHCSQNWCDMVVVVPSRA